MEEISGTPLAGYIYCVTCPASGRQYVGLTTTAIAVRWKAHVKAARSGKGSTVGNAIRKYGADAFAVTELARSVSHVELLELERRYIAELKTLTPNGYNRTSGGVGSQGLGVSEITRSAMSAAAASKWSDPAFRERQRAGRLAAWARRKAGEPKPQSQGLTPGGEEWLSRKRDARKSSSRALWDDPAKRERHAAGVKQRYEDPAYRERISVSARQNQSDPEYRRKMAESCKAAWTPERRAAHSLKQKAAWSDPAAYQRRAEINRRFWKRRPKAETIVAAE